MESYQSYRSVKQAYLNQQTLERKRILTRHLKNLLYSRNKLLYTYLDFFIDQLEDNLSKENIDKLKSWQVWLNQDEEEIHQTQDLTELYQKSLELGEIYPQMETEIFLQLGQHAVNNQQEVADQIKTIVIQLEPLTVRKDWVDEVNFKIENVEKLQKEGLLNLEETRVRRPGDMRRGWNSSLEYFNQAQEELNTALNYLDEVLKRVE